MTHRFLAFLLAGILAVAALDGFEMQREQAQSAAPASGDDGAVAPMDGGNPYPPVKKAY
jgi:hypothetical protein